MTSFTPAPIPLNDVERVKEVKKTGLFFTDLQESYKDFVETSSELAKCPLSWISLIDDKEQWLLSSCGFPEEQLADLRLMPRESTFCQFTILSPRPLIIEDTTADSRFSNHPFVVGDPFVRFYAGFPLLTDNGNVIGTYCLIDFEQRKLDPVVISVMEKLSRRITSSLLQYSRRLETDHQQLRTLLTKISKMFQSPDFGILPKFFDLVVESKLEHLSQLDIEKFIVAGLLRQDGDGRLVVTRLVSELRNEFNLQKIDRKIITVSSVTLQNQLDELADL